MGPLISKKLWMDFGRKEKTDEFWQDCSLNGRDFELSAIDRKRKTLMGITDGRYWFQSNVFPLESISLQHSLAHIMPRDSERKDARAGFGL